MATGTPSDARRRRSADAARTPAVRDFTQGHRAGYEVVVDTRTAYDFLISLTIGAGDEQDLQPEDARWLRGARRALSSESQQEIDACFGKRSKGVYHGLGTLIVEQPDIGDAASFVAAVERAGPRGIARALLPDVMQDDEVARLVDSALAGESAPIDELERRFGSDDQLREFLADPDASLDRTLRAMQAWLEHFKEVEPRVAHALQRDVTNRATDRASLDAAALVEKTTGGLRWVPDGNVRRVILAPSYFSRPYNYIFSGRDWRLFAYPIADEAIGANDPTAPPPGVVRLHRALGDATRLRVLRLLADRDWYLTELAQQLELSKPTMKHHLAQLRAAGLVTVVEQGTLTYYSLRRERLEQAGIELRAYLT